MKTNNAKGRAFTLIIGAYFVLKTLFNMVYGGFSLELSGWVFAVVAIVAMFSGLQFLNYGVSAFLALGILTHLPYNIMHLPGSIVYIGEAAVDVGVILLLILLPAIKQHFTNKWTELDQLFKP